MSGEAGGASVRSVGHLKRGSDRSEIMRASWGHALPAEPIALSR